MSQEIKKIQSIALAMFKHVEKICSENNIRYFAIGGTAIGAIRNKGFIPWDDDIDIVMPRKDFERFSAIAGQLLPEHLGIIDGTTDINSQEMAMRIHDKTTTMTDIRALTKTDNFLFKGVALDIMPLDGVPSSMFLYNIHRNKLRILYTLNAVANQTNKFNWKPRTVALSLISNALKPLAKSGYIKRAYKKSNSKYDFDSSKYLARTWWFASHDGMNAKARYFKEDFADFVELPFEDTIIRLPVGYDRYLSSLYPGYMTPPPKEKQIPHYFDGIIDLRHSYEYHIAKKEGKKIGYTAGCYDMFHIGHLNLIKRAKQSCDYLIVGVNADEAMFSYKNKYPVIPEDERMAIISALKYADEVVLVTNTDKMHAYNEHEYDVIFVGDDHKGEPKWVKLEEELNEKGSGVHYFGYTGHTSSTKLRTALDDIIEEKKLVADKK